MKLRKLLEVPEFKEGDRHHLLNMVHPEVCKKVDLKTIVKYDGISIKSPFDVRVIGNKYYCIDKDGTIASVLETSPTSLIKKYFKGGVIHEESIDTCKDYRGKRITTEFYKAILKHKISILSDYEHYSGTKRLWKSLSKQPDVIIQIYKKYKLIEKDYDLIKDDLNVWSSPHFLILATTHKIFEHLENRLIPIE